MPPPLKPCNPEPEAHIVNPFTYRDGVLHAEDVAVTQIAQQFGSPSYIYSRAALEHTFSAYQTALADTPHLICYAVKANSNLAVLNVLARLGAGFDIVSGGELERVIRAGGDASRVVFSGVAKTRAEMAQALDVGIHCFNVESSAELEILNEVAGEMGQIAPISVRVNPDVDAKTHPYISTGLKENKFGVTAAEALRVYQRAANMANLDVVGLDCHIGSQLTKLEPFIDALRRLLNLIDALEKAGITLRHLDVGGGLGVRYARENPPAIGDYIAALRAELDGRELTLLCEPGRSIVANAGILLTTVEYLKPTPEHNFALMDAAMNDLLRPALYGAWMDIIPVVENSSADTARWDVVGPVCETGDFLGKDRELSLSAGDLLAVCGAGAYGFVMSSNYNSRPRVAEIMVDGQQAHVVRERETVAELMRGEHLPPGSA